MYLLFWVDGLSLREIISHFIVRRGATTCITSSHSSDPVIDVLDEVVAASKLIYILLRLLPFLTFFF